MMCSLLGLKRIIALLYLFSLYHLRLPQPLHTHMLVCVRARALVCVCVVSPLKTSALVTTCNITSARDPLQPDPKDRPVRNIARGDVKHTLEDRCQPT